MPHYIIIYSDNNATVIHLLNRRSNVVLGIRSANEIRGSERQPRGGENPFDGASVN